MIKSRLKIQILSHTVDVNQKIHNVWSREICVVSREKLSCKSYNCAEEKLANNVPNKTMSKKYVT